jgi:hypothetical protein
MVGDVFIRLAYTIYLYTDSCIRIDIGIHMVDATVSWLVWCWLMLVDGLLLQLVAL